MDVKSTNKNQLATGGASNSLSTQTGGGNQSGSIPADFQSSQIDKILDAISLAMPANQRNVIGNFMDPDIKELAYDLGVDPRILKYKL